MKQTMCENPNLFGFACTYSIDFLILAKYTKHEKFFDWQIVRLPMSFFHTTPSGRIVNRFTKDTEALDVQVPSAVQSFLVCSSALPP